MNRTGEHPGGASSPVPPARRLFFALWPSEEERQVLSRWRATLPALHGRLVHSRDLHMTLAFAGAVNPATGECLVQGASRVRGSPFQVSMDCWGQFRRGLLWAGPADCPAPLLELARALTRVLEACGVRPDPRPFHPHVTLARGVPDPLHGMTPPGSVWRVDRFCLVHSRPGRHYAVLKTYSLHGDERGSLPEHSGSME